MNEIFKNGIVAHIKEIYSEIFSQNIRTFVQFIVTDTNGDFDSKIFFPNGSSFQIGETPNGKPIHAVNINISPTACSSFEYDEDTGDFIYQCRVNRQAFTGNIPAMNIINVFQPIEGEAPEYYFINPAPQIRIPEDTVEESDDSKKGKGGLRIVK